MRRNRWIAVAAAVAALGLGWYFGSQPWTLWQMSRAAEARDSETLASYIDFPTLRESTKEQLKAQMMAELGSGGEKKGFEALGAMMGMAMVGPMVDGLLTPEMLRAAFDKAPDRGEKAKDGPSAGREEAPFGIDAADAEIDRRGFDEFRLRKKDAAGEAGDLIFRRHGLGWKLSEIRIPKDAKSPKRGS